MKLSKQEIAALIEAYDYAHCSAEAALYQAFESGLEYGGTREGAELRRRQFLDRKEAYDGPYVKEHMKGMLLVNNNEIAGKLSYELGELPKHMFPDMVIEKLKKIQSNSRPQDNKMQEVNNEAQLEYTAEQIMAAREHVVCIKMGMVIPVDLRPEFWSQWGAIDDKTESACKALGLTSWSEIVKASGRTGECFLDES